MGIEVIVEVTEQDIKHGFEWSYIRMTKKYGKNFDKFEMKRCEYCPVAIALARTFGQKVYAETYRLTIGDRKYRTPEIVSDWMYEFDKGLTNKPFSFELNDETEVAREEAGRNQERS